MGGLHFAHQLQPQLAPFRPFKTEVRVVFLDWLNNVCQWMLFMVQALI